MKNTIAFIKESFKEDFIATLVTLIVMAGIVALVAGIVIFALGDIKLALSVVAFSAAVVIALSFA